MQCHKSNNSTAILTLVTLCTSNPLAYAAVAVRRVLIKKNNAKTKLIDTFILDLVFFFKYEKTEVIKINQFIKLVGNFCDPDVRFVTRKRASHS